MSSSEQIPVQGLRALQEALVQLPDRIAKNILRGGVRAMCRVVADEAKRLAPVEREAGHRGTKGRGALRKSIRVNSPRVFGEWPRVRVVGGVSTSLFYARFVELGTAAHAIGLKNGARAMPLGDGQFAGVVNHPGAQKKPFLRPALDSKAQEAVEALREYLRKRIPEEIEKLNRQAKAKTGGR